MLAMCRNVGVDHVQLWMYTNSYNIIIMLNVYTWSLYTLFNKTYNLYCLLYDLLLAKT